MIVTNIRCNESINGGFTKRINFIYPVICSETIQIYAAIFFHRVSG